MSAPERRVHARIQITLEVRVSGPKGVTYGELRDFSKGGAAILIPEAVAAVHETVDVTINFADQSEVTISGRVVRCQELNSQYLMGIRFDMIEPLERDQLHGAIEKMLQSRGSKERKHPRITKILPIKLAQVQNLKALIETISMGGLGIKVKTPLILDQEINLEIEGFNGEKPIILKGRVLYQHPIQEWNKDSEYRVGLQFDELSEHTKARLHALIHQVLALQIKP